MIQMKMADEDGADAPHVHAQPGKLVDSAIACIDQDLLVAGDQQIGWLRPVRRRNRAARRQTESCRAAPLRAGDSTSVWVS